MAKLRVEDLELKGKRVLMRVDFNVPMNEKREVTDDTRIRAALPTIKYILKREGRLVLMSHLGRPKGKVVEELRLNPIAKCLSELLGVEVRKLDECVGPDVEGVAKGLKEGEVILLENLRFDPAEEKCGEEFSRQLANLGEVYVNDAFGTAHRAHASTVGVTKYLHSCAAGYLMEKELLNLGKLTDEPEKPFVAIIGGAKISGKIQVIQNLLNVVN
jgi:phosphoglycerate kinase